MIEPHYDVKGAKLGSLDIVVWFYRPKVYLDTVNSPLSLKVAFSRFRTSSFVHFLPIAEI
jgi:hypothetical protein